MTSQNTSYRSIDSNDIDILPHRIVSYQSLRSDSRVGGGVYGEYRLGLHNINLVNSLKTPPYIFCVSIVLRRHFENLLLRIIKETYNNLRFLTLLSDDMNCYYCETKCL